MSWILTHSGRHFNYLDPRADDIHILDIAEGLSKESRYNGHTRGFYSVAQHAWHCSQIVPPAFRLEALLHDATEAYCKDIPRPLKDQLPDYRAIEARVDAAIRAKYRLPVAMTPTTHKADLILLATERRDLMPADPTPWPILDGIEPLARPLITMTPPRASALFLKRYLELTEDRRST
jgi:uncharacterized protein